MYEVVEKKTVTDSGVVVHSGFRSLEDAQICADELNSEEDWCWYKVREMKD